MSDRQSCTSLDMESDDGIGQGTRPEGGRSQPSKRSMWVRLDGEVQLTPLETEDAWLGDGQEKGIREALERSHIAEKNVQELAEHTSQVELKLEELKGEQRHSEERLRNLQQGREEGFVMAQRKMRDKIWKCEEKVDRVLESGEYTRRFIPPIKGKQDKHKCSLMQEGQRMQTWSQAQSQKEEEERQLATQESEGSSGEEKVIVQAMPEAAARQLPVIVKRKQTHNVP